MVCRSVTLVRPAKTAELKMPFGLRTCVGPRNHVLDGVQITPCEGAILGDRTCRPTCHPSQRQMRSSAGALVELLPVRTSAFVAARGDGGWQIRFNHPCVAAMRPFVKLLWPLVVFGFTSGLPNDNLKNCWCNFYRPDGLPVAWTTMSRFSAKNLHNKMW